MELLDYTDADLALSVALETDAEVMAELGGPRSLEAIERVHPKRVAPLAGGGLWLKIVPDGMSEAVGTLGVWRSQWRDEDLWEVGWMLLPAFHGRGLASEALGLLIERLRAEPRFDVVHAFPGVTNAPSNALCAKFGFELVERGEVEFDGRPLVCNHWTLRVASG
jgi:RimJ/RimL family protein N-acetyltransferase